MQSAWQPHLSTSISINNSTNSSLENRTDCSLITVQIEKQINGYCEWGIDTL